MKDKKEELVKYLVDNFLDEYGTIDISNLDFKDFADLIIISRIKGDIDISQNSHKNKGSIDQGFHKNQGEIVQHSHQNQGHIFQRMQRNKGDFVQDGHKTGGKVNGK